ncbi:MAG: adenosylcobinamide-GDP ribazoletransferase [Lentisphaerales bacterium]|nr:adenosylcobinamide-GDP ribazoletransferase [Lentisphaerales bacterium]
MKSFFLALSLLSRIPVSSKLYTGIKNSESATVYFPLVGLILGGLSTVFAYGLGSILPNWPLAVCVTIFLGALSGFLHLDGVADCGDGFLSSRPAERILEIMKDPRIGAMGTLSLVFVVLLKLSLLISLIQKFDLQTFCLILLLTPFAGRCALLWHMRLTPVLGEGLGKSFWNRSLGMQLSNFMLYGLVNYFLFPEYLLINIAIQLSVAILWSLYSKSKISGGTGDTLGVACEIGEIALLTAFII